MNFALLGIILDISAETLLVLPLILSPFLISNLPSSFTKSSLISTTFRSVITSSITILSFNWNVPLFWTGSIIGYLFLLTIVAYPDWKVFAIPGLVDRPAKLNLTIACVPAIYS